MNKKSFNEVWKNAVIGKYLKLEIVFLTALLLYFHFFLIFEGSK